MQNLVTGLIYLSKAADHHAVFPGPRFPVEFHMLSSGSFFGPQNED